MRRTRSGGYRYDPYTGQEVGMRQGGIGSLPMPGTSQPNLYNTVAAPVGTSPVGQRDFSGPMRYKEGSASVPNMTATAGMNMPTVGGQVASYRNPTVKPPTSMPGWTPADILNPPGLGGGPDRSQRPRGKSYGGGGQRGWKPIGMNITTQSHLSGPGTGQYFPGTASEDANRQTQQRVDAFLAEAQRAGAPRSQIEAGVAAIKSGGSLPSGFGAGGGGGGNNAMVQDVISDYQRAMDSANAANEARYQDVLSGRWQLLQKQMQDMLGLGQQEITDTNLGYDAQKADVLQSMVDRGLSNTTVQDTQKMGVERERQHEINRINERLAKERMALERGLTEGIFGHIGSKQDDAPDFGQLMQLLQMFGASGGGGGGGQSLPPLLAGGGPVFMDASAMGFNVPGAAFGGPIMGNTYSQSQRPRQQSQDGPPLILGTKPKPKVGPPRRRYDPSLGGFYDWGVGDLPKGGIPTYA